MAAQPDTTRLICLTGPESSGKSTLAAQLAKKLSLSLVPEIARDALEPGALYTEARLRQIAIAQQAVERDALARAPRVIADTDILVIALWWREKFARSPTQPWPNWLQAPLRKRSPRLYLLCSPDLPWEPDPLRENPHDRQRLAAAYLTLLREGPHPWKLVTGRGQTRLRLGLGLAKDYLANNA